MKKYSCLLFISISCLLLAACRQVPVGSPTLPPPADAPTPLPVPTLTQTPTPPAVLPVIGYLPDYRTLNPEWGNYLTDLIYFSAEPTVEGELDASRLSPVTLQVMRDMKAAYGTRLFISLGGYDRSANFGPMVTDPSALQKFITALLAFARDNALDGIDFDWEFPANDAELAGYLALMDAVRQAGLIVSVALYPYPDIDLQPYQNVDRVYIMSYDRGPQHATYEQAVADLDFFLQGGLPREKLFLGVPFYGRLTVRPYTPYPYADIVASYAPSPDLDEVDGIYFNGIDTIQKKGCYVKQNGFGGVMIWELGQDSADDTSLLRAIHAAATGSCQP